MATPSRVNRNSEYMSRAICRPQQHLRFIDLVRSSGLNTIFKVTRQFAANPPTKKVPDKCDMSSKMKPKPGYFPSGGTHAIMNDLPLPKGDFMANWKAKNFKYNMVLLSGLLAAIGSIGLCLTNSLMNYTRPEYPYTDEELDAFAQEEERIKKEKEEHEEQKQELKNERDMKVRRRKAKEAMVREMELMQKDIDEGISDKEMKELQKLTQEREEYEAWEKNEAGNYLKKKLHEKWFPDNESFYIQFCFANSHSHTNT